MFQVQGNIAFSTCEVLVRNVLNAPASLRFLILDLKHVLAIDESACRLLYQLSLQLTSQDRTVVFSRARTSQLCGAT